MKSKHVLYLVVLLVFTSIIFLSACNAKDDKNEKDEGHLYFQGEQFKILQLTDFHEWMGIEKTLVEVQDSLKPHLVDYIEKVLADEKPDLVVLTGDNIFSLSSMQDLLNKISIKTYWEIARLFEKHEQYWSMTFGNHDSESVKNKEDFLRAVKDYPYFIGGLENTEYYRQLVGDDERIGNFSIPILNQDGKAVFNVFLLDSGSFNSVQPSSVPYKYITNQQCDWYKAEAERLKAANNGNVVPSVLFTHIPLFEHKEAYESDGERIGVWNGFSPSDTRSRIFEDAMTMGDVVGIFTGHNHNNSISVVYQRGQRKIMLGITPQAAAASYSDTTSTLYSRVILVKTDGSLTSYIHTSAKNDVVAEGLPHEYVFRNEILSI